MCRGAIAFEVSHVVPPIFFYTFVEESQDERLLKPFTVVKAMDLRVTPTYQTLKRP
ncbi:hypothetical protein STEG23_006627, partial [Scotinomys teguina]